MKQKSPKTTSKNELRLKVLRILETNPDLSQRQLAEKLGVSLGGVNYAMRALVNKGFVKVHNFRSANNKVAYIYQLTPQGLNRKTQLASAFLGRKLKEYNVLKQEIELLKIESTSMKQSRDLK